MTVATSVTPTEGIVNVTLGTPGAVILESRTMTVDELRAEAKRAIKELKLATAGVRLLKDAMEQAHADGLPVSQEIIDQHAVFVVEMDVADRKLCALIASLWGALFGRVGD